MKSVYTVEIVETEATGGWDGAKYTNGRGKATTFSRMASQRIAEQACERSLYADNLAQGLEGIGLIPVYREVRVWKDGRLIEERY